MEAPEIKLEHDAPDRLVPKDFKKILVNRLVPVLSLTYISSVIGIAAKKGDFMHYLFQDKTAYVMALFVVFWVSMPAILWVFLKGSINLYHVADVWFKIAATIMSSILFFSFVLIPEANAYGARIYFVASVPIFFVMYFFFIKGSLPPLAAHPLSALGVAFLLYGAATHFLY